MTDTSEISVLTSAEDIAALAHPQARRGEAVSGPLAGVCALDLANAATVLVGTTRGQPPFTRPGEPMSATATTSTMRELARRANGAMVIALVWDTVHDAVILSVDDLATGDRIRVAPHRGRERYAFEHPFGCLSSLTHHRG